MPTNRPIKHRPRCHRTSPYTSLKTNWKAPKKRYKIPSKIAEKTHKFRHIGSKVRRRRGRYIDRRTVCVTERCSFSIGAFHRSSPDSWRSFCALRLSSLSSPVSTRKQVMLDVRNTRTLGDKSREREKSLRRAIHQSISEAHRMSSACRGYQPCTLPIMVYNPPCGKVIDEAADTIFISISLLTKICHTLC